MKNVTITLDEEVARWAKVWAAQHDTSVSRMLGEMLRERMAGERAYETAMKRYLRREVTALKGPGRYPSREQLHER